MASGALQPNLLLQPGGSVVKEIIEKELLPQLPSIRRDRTTYKEKWLRFYKIWSCEADQQSYRGRSQIFLPIGRRLIENYVTRTKRDLMPTDDLMAVSAIKQQYADRERAVQAVQSYFLTKQIRLRRQLTPFLRQAYTYGTSPVSITWRLDERLQPVLKEQLDEVTNEPTGEGVVQLERTLNYLGPTFRVCDLFTWHLWPYTVQDVDDATIVFEDQLVPRHRVYALAKKPIHPIFPELGTVYDPDAVFEAIENLAPVGDKAKEKYEAEARRLNNKGFPATLDAKLLPSQRPIDVTECYWKRDLDGDGIPERLRVTILGDSVPVCVQANPFWHGMTKWLAAKPIEVENEFYGRSILELIDKLSYYTNDLANQAADAMVWSLNPIALIDLFKVQDPTTLRMRPGAKWLVAPDGVEFKEPPKESATIGFNAVGQMLSLAKDFADITPPLSGASKSRGKATQTTAGMQMALVESLLPVKDLVENLEDQVFGPFCKMSHLLTMQFLDRPLILKIAGAEGAPLVEQSISVEDLIGDYDFTWLGSTNAQNQQVRAGQMIQFMQVAGKLPPEILQAQGIEIVWSRLLKTFYREGLGLPGADQIIRDLKPKETVDPRIENALFLAGRGSEVVVREGDDDDGHLQSHHRLLASGRLQPEQVPVLGIHVRRHVAGKMAKQQQAQQQQQMQMLQQIAQLSGGKGGGGASNGNGMKPAGNPGRTSSTQDVGDLLRQAPRGSA